MTVMTGPSEPASFGSVLGRHARNAPDATAVCYADDALNWRALDEASDAWAAALAERGLQTNDRIILAAPNGVLHHVLGFAIWKAGGVPCIVPHTMPAPELDRVIDLARPVLLIGAASDTMPAAATIGLNFVPAPVAMTSWQDAVPADSWKAVLSGGSTGLPKMIVDTAPARLGGKLDAAIARLRIPRSGTILNPGPLYHNAPFLFTNLALLAGTRVVGLPKFDAEECLRLIEQHRVGLVSLVPTMMHRIWSLPRAVRNKYDVSSLHTVWHMAAACPAWLKRAWIDWLGPDVIMENYAGTETRGTTISGREWLERPGSVGRVAADTLTIRRADGTPCAIEEIGEIFFPASAAKDFRYEGATVTLDGAGRFSLGDMGYVDADGYLFLSDRNTDLIIRGGANIYPAEIEAALDEHPSVAASVAISLPSEEFGQRVHAIVEPQPGHAPTAAQLDAFLRARLSRYKCPESYEIAAGPLRNEAGKVRRSAEREKRLAWLSAGREFQLFVFNGAG